MGRRGCLRRSARWPRSYSSSTTRPSSSCSAPPTAGLIETSSDPSDGRRQLLDVTDAGDEKLASLSLLHRDELRRFRLEMNDVLRELD